jgi:hypothetical protein
MLRRCSKSSGRQRILRKDPKRELKLLSMPPKCREPPNNLSPPLYTIPTVIIIDIRILLLMVINY